MKFSVLKIAALSLIATLIIYGTWREFQARSPDGERLAIRWEGLWINNNYRDLGDSLNSCLGQTVFAKEVIKRANVWFSGWSCDGVGNPSVIYSLNYSRKRQERYFCSKESGERVIGKFFQQDMTVLNDLEFLSTWDNASMRETACGFFKDSFQEIANGQRILAHCDAGKDRTGTYAALTAGLTAEIYGLLNDKMIEAIECDYRKSRSLEKDKYGRMAALINELQKLGGIEAFFVNTCGIEPAVLHQTASRFKSSSLTK